MKITILGRGAWGRAIGTLVARLGHETTFASHRDAGWAAGDGPARLRPARAARAACARNAPTLRPARRARAEPEQRTRDHHGRAGHPDRHGRLGRDARWARFPARPSPGKSSPGCPPPATIAARDEALAEEFQAILHQASFRTYRSTDLTGVELGGALKNVYAIAGGACAGLKLGQNSAAGLITRCLAEMTRIGVQAGARARKPSPA